MTASHALPVLALLALATGASAAEPAVLGGLRLPTLLTGECPAVAFKPVAAYLHADYGEPLGRLVLDRPELAAKDQPSCSARPVVHFQPAGGARGPKVEMVEVGYEELALAVYATRRHAGQLWVKGRTQAGASFWVEAPIGAEYLSYERDLVQDLERFTETCDERGRCTPVLPRLQALAREAGQAREDTCYGNAFDITEVFTLPGGRAAYRVRLAESLVPQYGSTLPREALVPTYDRSGTWTGFFYSRGC